MLRDITIGQHFPRESVIHRFDPRLKIVVTIGYVIILFVGTNPFGIAASIVLVLLGYIAAKIPPRMVLRSIKPLLPILLFTAILNIFFTGGQPIFSWWIFTVTREGIYYALIMGVRIVCLIAGTSLLTYTTSPIVLTDAIERLLSPLRRFGFPAHELAMMMTIALRFIPTLIEETDKIMNAQKARGAELDSGTLVQRVKALIPVLIPLFLSAFRRADELATAMECRCYRGGDGRTRLRQMHVNKADILLVLLCILFFVAIGFSGMFWTFLQPG